MVDVVTSNFTAELPRILDAIRCASYVALDTELTGLMGGAGNQRRFLHETPAQRYARQRREPYTVVQVGLAAFRWDAQQQRHEASVFNVWCFPRAPPSRQDAPDIRVQPGAFAFLSSVGFDFNRLVKEGVPWLTNEQAAAERARRETQRNWEPINVPEKDASFIGGEVAKAEEWLGSKPEEKSLVLAGCNSFLRLVLFQQCSLKFPSTAIVEIKAADQNKPQEKNVVVTRAIPEEIEAAKQAKVLKDEQDVEAMTGFTKIWEALCESGKPIVGHNMFIDMMELVWQFGSEGKELPAKLEDFKAIVHKQFPLFFDTKCITSSCTEIAANVPDTSLSKLHATLAGDSFAHAPIAMAPGFEKYSDSGAFHEAGFDAFVTGSVFATLCKNVCLMNGGGIPAGVEPGPLSPSMAPYANKIFAMNSVYPYYNFDGEEVYSDRIFVIKEFPKEWDNKAILKALKVNASDITIKWLDDTSAIIIAHENVKAESLHTALAGTAVKVVDYNDYISCLPAPMDTKSPVVTTESPAIDPKSSAMDTK